MKAIGILGGMGPRATVLFEQMLICKFNGSDQQMPTIICMNDGSIPDRSNFILGKGISPVPKIIKNAQMLERLGANVLVMPCNTAHAQQIAVPMQAMVGIPLLNMPELTISALVDRGIKSVCLLATDGTIASCLYQDLCLQANIYCAVPPPGIQNIVMRVINNTKRGLLLAAQIDSVQIQSFLSRSSCEAVILGCTELTFMRNTIVPKEKTEIDTLEILADACVGYTNNQFLAKEIYDTR